MLPPPLVRHSCKTRLALNYSPIYTGWTCPFHVVRWRISRHLRLSCSCGVLLVPMLGPARRVATVQDNWQKRTSYPPNRCAQDVCMYTDTTMQSGDQPANSKLRELPSPFTLEQNIVGYTPTARADADLMFQGGFAKQPGDDDPNAANKTHTLLMASAASTLASLLGGSGQRIAPSCLLCDSAPLAPLRIRAEPY